jgi:hypothetical protein
VLDDKNHQIALTPVVPAQFLFTGGQWRRPPEKSRENRDLCHLSDGKFVPGEQTVQDESALTPQPDGSLRGLLTTTVVSSECGSEGMVWQVPYTLTRVGDLPPGLPLPDPSTVSLSLMPDPAPPVIGPQLDGTYRMDYDLLHQTAIDPADPTARETNHTTRNVTRWSVFQSICTASGCVATGVGLDDVNHQQAASPALPVVYRFIDGHWAYDEETLMSCDSVNQGGRGSGSDAAQTVKKTTELALQTNGTLGGVQRTTIDTDECGARGLILTTPITATRAGAVPPGVVLADPALFG